MEEFVGEYFLEPSEVDWDYEFDAYQFYDFTRGETNSEAGEMDRWFETAGSYPPSPLITKYLRKSISSSSNDAKCVESTSKKPDVTACSQVSQSTKKCKGTEKNVKIKTKSVLSPSKQWNSTLMKPTASHLAKLNRRSHAHSNNLCGRSHNFSTHIGERREQNPHAFDNADTKRQKLEMGYLRKVAELKHQNLLLHKIIVKGGRGTGNVANFKTNVTIPKEPELETQQRAQNRSSRNNAETCERAEPRAGTFKARPLNKQILQAPSLLQHKKSTRQLPEFKVFHLRTMERAMNHSSSNDLSTQNSNSTSHCVAADSNRSKSQSHHVFKMKNETPLKIRTRPLINSKIFPTKEDIEETEDSNESTIPMESKLSKNEKLSQNPPTDLFNKLSLISELDEMASQPKVHLPTKVLKENAPNSFQPEFWRCVGKPNQRGNSRGIQGITNQPNMNR